MEHWDWPDFTPAEIACRDGSLMVNADAMDILQCLRVILDFPLIITSAYRSPSHNMKVGGVPSSQHLIAKAFDVAMTGIDPILFEKSARDAGFTGFGFYKDQAFMHIDIGRPRFWGSRWSKIIPRTVGFLDGTTPDHKDFEELEILEGEEDAMSKLEFQGNKPWYKSRGVVGSVIAIGSQVLAFTGIDISPTDQVEISTGIFQIIASTGTLLALWGRIAAKMRIS